MNKKPLTLFEPRRTLIAPSLLAADFARLGEEIKAVETAGADIIHIDVMDGHFVPNLSMGPPVVKSIRRVTALPFDVHLMLEKPEPFIESFAEAGADHITIHSEASGDLVKMLRRIHALGCSAGVSIRPKTEASALLPLLEAVDMVLIMTVEPGFGGQAFAENMLPKITRMREHIGRRPVHIEVDGGINAKTAALCRVAGANVLVAGTSIFGASAGIPAAIAQLRG